MMNLTVFEFSKGWGMQSLLYTSTTNCNTNGVKMMPVLSCGRFRIIVISSPEPKAHAELIVYQSICRLCVSVSVSQWVHTFKHFRAIPYKDQKIANGARHT